MNYIVKTPRQEKHYMVFRRANSTEIGKQLSLVRNKKDGTEKMLRFK